MLGILPIVLIVVKYKQFKCLYKKNYKALMEDNEALASDENS